MTNKQQLTAKEKQLDTDLWLILLITLGVFGCYAVMGDQIMAIVQDDSRSIIQRLLLNAAIQYGVAGLGITIVCIWRKEKFTDFGLRRKNIFKAILGTVVCFIPYLCYVFLSGQFNGYQPFSIFITDEVLAGGIPFSIIGMALIIIVWGFFEGFNYVVISEIIDRRYPSKNPWLDYGAITCAVICILFHPFSTSFWGIIEIITTFISIYGMLIVRKQTGNAWGCILAFCFIWNAI